MARPMTVAEKILAAHAGLDEVVPGQLIECNLDIVHANDVTAPIAIDVCRKISDKVFDPKKVVLVPDPLHAQQRHQERRASQEDARVRT